MATEKPPIRLLHQMARSGGTVICKCLASMTGVALLSEIHPEGLTVFHPLHQAQAWYGLFTEQEIDKLKSVGPLKYVDLMALIDARFAARDLTPVIRDWSHMDFTAVPFLAAPSYKLRNAAALAERFSIRATASVRHPVDQWLSFDGHELTHGKIALDAYLKGYRMFAEHCVVMGFVRYEDFAHDPDAALRVLCERLGLAFDSGYRERWARYTNITGDVREGAGKAEIALAPRKPLAPALLDAFAANADYRRALELLGYEHPT